MEKSEISLHEIRVFKAVKDAGRWITNHEIASAAGKISERTVRAHTLKLVKLGLIDQAEVFPSHRYRLAEKAAKRNGSYLIRLTKAAEVFGIEL
jgi:DNA-binding transcriptional ArsR family regulator